MKKLNEKGFGIIESLLIIIAVTLIAGVGYYVYDSNSKKNDSIKPSQGNSYTSQEPVNNPDDRLTGDYQELHFTFKYYKEWKASVDSENNTMDFFKVLASAPNTTKEGEEAYPYVVTGAEISIYKDARYSPASLTEYKNQKGTTAQFNTNIKDFKVDGVEAISFDWGYEGPEKHIVKFIKDSASYDISIEKTVYAKPEYKKAFDDLISSIEFR
jgi:hypothetical protein